MTYYNRLNIWQYILQVTPPFSAATSAVFIQLHIYAVKISLKNSSYFEYVQVRVMIFGV